MSRLGAIVSRGKGAARHAVGRVVRAVEPDYPYLERRLDRSLRRQLGRVLHHGAIARNADARVLVILHMFYPGAVREICQYLRNLEPYDPDLVVSYVPESCPVEALTPIVEAFPSARLVTSENRGYDLAPFFAVLADIDLDAYDVVFKLHSKSVGRERLVYGARFGQREWFLRLFDGILGPFTVHDTIEILTHDDDCGLVAERKVLGLTDPPYQQRMVAAKLRKRGLREPDGPYQFVGGTCFAVRASALRPLQESGIEDKDFAPTRYGVFSLAHAIERYLCLSIAWQGLQLKGVATHPLWEAYSARIAQREWQHNGHRMREALGLRFTDDDMLYLGGIYHNGWSLDEFELGSLLYRDADYNVVSLRELDERGEGFFRKYLDPWVPSAELTSFVEQHFMRVEDPELDAMVEPPWSQAIVAKTRDSYLMCGHDLAFELYRQLGPDARVPVARYVERYP